MAEITPADVDILIEDGFQYIVVDPAAYSPGLEAKWVAAFSSFCEQLWGKPYTEAAGGRSWRISKIPETVIIEDIEPVERLGPRTEQEQKFVPE